MKTSDEYLDGSRLPFYHYNQSDVILFYNSESNEIVTSTVRATCDNGSYLDIKVIFIFTIIFYSIHYKVLP